MTEDIRELEEYEYFYTTHTPHAWSSGPHEHTWDPDNHYLPIASLERAKELALAAQMLTGSEDRVVVTWGAKLIVKQDIDYYGNPRDPKTDPLLDRFGNPVPED